MTATNSGMLAKQLIRKLATDPKFRSALTAAASHDDKKAVLSGAGFGGLSEEDVVNAAAPAVQEIRDQELVATASGAASASGDTITTVTTTTTVWAGAAAAVAAA
jgi:predicted ribosomally synthesized peptide with nif11-like leader